MVTTVPAQVLGSDFQRLEEGPAQRWVRLRFHGPCAGEEIRWVATFRIREPGSGRNIIEIGAARRWSPPCRYPRPAALRPAGNDPRR